MNCFCRSGYAGQRDDDKTRPEQPDLRIVRTRKVDSRIYNGH